jgi:hypothetical protein
MDKLEESGEEPADRIEFVTESITAAEVAVALQREGFMGDVDLIKEAGDWRDLPLSQDLVSRVEAFEADRGLRVTPVHYIRLVDTVPVQYLPAAEELDEGRVVVFTQSGATVTAEGSEVVAETLLCRIEG